MEEFINNLLSQGLYPMVVIVLVLCGLGVPFPEEAVFLTAGYVGSKHDANLWILCACGIVGILLGDSIPYWVGRKYGLKVIKRRPFSWFMSEKGIEKTRGFFGKHGSKAVFCGRFVAGLRMPTFFMSGSMGVSYVSFLLWDLLGAMISCPTSIYLAFHYGKKAEEMLRESKGFLFAGIGLVVLYIVYHVWSHREKPEAPKLTESVSSAPAAPPAAAPVQNSKVVQAE